MSWQDLAIKWADKIGVPRDIMLTTVEAETNGVNKLGDSGNALGFGQVWGNTWHYEKLKAAASDLNITNIPAKGDLSGLQTLVLGNDELSMNLAARAIKGFWDGAGGDFNKFVHGYVGEAVPDAEVKRRNDIWAKYRNGSVSPSPASSDKSTIGVDVTGIANPALVGWMVIGAGVLIMIKTL
jgi:Leucine-rich repeat (LRR) protein